MPLIASDAVANGFKHGARVVTAAALIMMSVFAAFILVDEPFIVVMGFALATAVLFDAFIVRMTIIPATMFLISDHAWRIPGWLDHMIPHIDIEGENLTDNPTRERQQSSHDRSEGKKKEETRRTIARSAAELLASVGDEQTTIAAIAERANISPRTFHNYFPSRESAFEYFFGMLVEHWVDAIRTAPPELGPLEVMQELVTKNALRDATDPYSLELTVQLLHRADLIVDDNKKCEAKAKVKLLSDTMYERYRDTHSELEIHVLVNLAVAAGGLAQKMQPLAAPADILDTAFGILRNGFPD